MGRKAKPTNAEIVRRLVAIKLTIAGMKGALPNARDELQRTACESIDDLIGEIA